MYSKLSKHYFVVELTRFDTSLPWEFIAESDDYKWLVTCEQLAQETKG